MSMRIGPDYPERVYAGWLGKVIGVRLGAPVEGMTHQEIIAKYGYIDRYIIDVSRFAADDDTNCPLVFLQTLEDYGLDATPYEFGLNWLNYAPYEHGFFWWGGYGISTEHTAYQNLYHGIMAPDSGSARLNGTTVAEQIGGQIFVDPFGLIAPGRPSVAADYAERSSRVSHDGNGIYGARFIAACISMAFVESDMMRIVKAALDEIPSDSEYRRMADDVIAFYEKHPEDWEAGYDFVFRNYGYDKYPGTCHIIPNAAIVILSLLYGKGDFDRTVVICNLCGWDTDCNAGNVGTIMGVKCGLSGIDHDKWVAPLQDFFVSSSVIGSRNIIDIPTAAWRTAKIGYELAGEEVPEQVLRGLAARTFELPGSTHGFKARVHGRADASCELSNTDEAAFEGRRSLKLRAHELFGGELSLYCKPYYEPGDFMDNRYEPELSPTLYPGQSLDCAVMTPCRSVTVQLYINDRNSDRDILLGPCRVLEPGEWTLLSCQIPPMEGACIREAGVRFKVNDDVDAKDFIAYLDAFEVRGEPRYTIDFAKGGIEKWSWCQRNINQFTRFKGSWRLESDALVGSCADRGEVYTGGHTVENYTLKAALKPLLGSCHRLLFRVQGAARSYAIALKENKRLVLEKNANGYGELASVPFDWQHDAAYGFEVTVYDNEIYIKHAGKLLIKYTDAQAPYLSGQLGLGVADASCCSFQDIEVIGIAKGEKPCL